MGEASKEECFLLLSWILVAVVLPLVAILVTAIVLWTVWHLRRRFIELRTEGNLQKLKNCIRETNNILFPMSVMFGDDFKVLGKMLLFEDARDKNFSRSTSAPMK